MAASGGLTPAYAAPEFFNGQATQWSDQYCLAVSYCHLRGGRLPTDHLTHSPDLTMLPETERPVVLRALAKRPEERWPDCRAFVAALAAVMASTGQQGGSAIAPATREPPPTRAPGEANRGQTEPPEGSSGVDAPKVFVSYSHDSEDHREQVLALSDRLRDEGIACVVDQYIDSPPEGFPRWTEKQIREADFVLVVCTPIYYRRVMGLGAEGIGQGVRFEGHLIYQHLYNADMVNSKFIPVLLTGGSESDIPDPLRAFKYYRPQTEPGYDELYRRLTSQPATPPPRVGPRRHLPPRSRARKADQQDEEAADPPGAEAERRLQHKLYLPPNFTGRSGDLDQAERHIRASLAEGASLSFVGFRGMGGIGKTALAAALA
jgi:hypothetical protein